MEQDQYLAQMSSPKSSTSPRDQNYTEKILQSEARVIIIQLILAVTQRHATKQR